MESIIEENYYKKILICMPVFNDWESFLLLVEKLDLLLASTKITVEILAIDDGSTIPFPKENWKKNEFQTISKIQILHLSRNIGHQRAIAICMAHLNSLNYANPVLIMDSDGEDTPEDALLLIQALSPTDSPRIIFAQRSKRSEGLFFRFFYFLYKKIYRFLVGQKIEFGNFSILHPEILQRLAVVAELWNHYPASVLKAKIAYSMIPTKRGKRLAGKSKMNLSSLILHGLSALSVSSDLIGARALIGTIALSCMTLFMMGVVLAIRFFTNKAIPGWTSYLVVSFTIILIQSAILSLFFIFMILQGRNYSNFIPCRDFSYYILKLEEIDLI